MGPILEEIMDEVKDFFVEEKDPFFKRGERKVILKTAVKMKVLGLPTLTIAQVTGLTPEEIHNINLSEKP